MQQVLKEIVWKINQINFICKFERNEGAIMFFIIEKSKETTFKFSKNSVSII